MPTVDGIAAAKPAVVDLVGPAAAAPIADSRTAYRTVRFDDAAIEARVWLPPDYQPGRRYPILYLADGGGTSPGSLLTDRIRDGTIPPLLVVGIDYCAPADKGRSDCRNNSYLTPAGAETPTFLAHERFVLKTLIPSIEKQYGAPPESRLRAIGGASSGAVWAASMALRHPDLFGTAFVMSPGVPTALHPEGKPGARFHVTAGLLERPFLWQAGCLAGRIVASGGTATLKSYPAGHDPTMWARVLLDDVSDWLAAVPVTPVLAPAAAEDCLPW